MVRARDRGPYNKNRRWPQDSSLQLKETQADAAGLAGSAVQAHTAQTLEALAHVLHISRPEGRNAHSTAANFDANDAPCSAPVKL
eukprot:CAMPEP_0195129498 /NCGR_PEP_ID=MMETSP0448-20130528/141281_1 /TAXON_ID=66468 /ORGANISM="Heterocapsa triquestra, Strain CCMP 448" /LENGTH=84 /DNA_ID=CAMNT_0040167343 /DNA_START=104 /DNA_END=359 /DNA_ORIENTATION=+